ncbi:MAG: chloramphenicol hydrolase [Pseudomonadota bacterium]|jgi:acetyl esterase
MALHPFVRTMMDAARAAGRPGLSGGTPAQARELVAAGRAALGRGPEVGPVGDLSVPTRAGAVSARLYRAARADDEVGLVVYLHGGGWVCGSVDDYDLLARALVAHSGCAVLSVEYRLAPEHPFPAGLEDAEDAVAWAAANACALLGAPRPVAVAGDSAGANLATVAAARLEGRVPIALQCLFYPVADADLDRPSYREHGEGLPLTRGDMDWFFRHYVDDARRADPEVAPVRRADLSGSSPAWIVAAQYDVLRDEALAYGEALRRAGVPVETRVVPGLAHGFARLFNHLPEADAVVRDAARALRAALTAGARRVGATAA